MTLLLPITLFLQAGPAAAAAPVQEVEVEVPELEAAAEDQSARALPLSQIVLVAAKRPQALRDVAASVSLVNAEAIDQYDLKSLAEIVDGQAGFYSSNNHDFTYLGVRGVGVPGGYNSRLLVLVDGHTMNELWSNAVYPEALGIDPSIIERVEILRGPTSALYGSLGFQGIVNVVTKRGTGDRWIHARAEYRDLREVRGTVTASHRFSTGTEFLLSLTGWENPGRERRYVERATRPGMDGADLSGTCHEAIPSTCTDGVSPASQDRERALAPFLRVQHGPLTLHGAFSYWEKRLPMAPYETLFNDPDNRYLFTRGFLEGRFDQAVLPDRLSLSARAYYDWSRYNDDLAYTGEAGTPEERTVFHDDGDGDWTGGELQLALTAVRREGLVDEITLGGEVTRLLSFSRSGYVGDFPITVERDLTMGSVYAQNELTLGDRQVLLLLGLRGDFNDVFQSEVSPRAALILQPYPSGTYKFIYSHGFVNPNPYFAFFDDGIDIARNEALRPERADNYEVIYQHAVGKIGAVSASLFYSRYRDLVVQNTICVPDPESEGSGPCPAGEDDREQSQNLLSMSSYGLELMAEVTLTSRLRTYLNYTYAIAERDDLVRMVNAPRHLLHAGASIPVIKRHLFVSPELRLVGERELFEADPDPADLAPGAPLRAGAYAWVNLALVLQDLPVKGLRASAKVTNLFDVRRVDPALAEDTQPVNHFVAPGISAFFSLGYSL